MIAEAAGWRGELVFDSARPDGAPIKILDTRKMTEKLGAWYPATRLADGIARTVAWYEEHREEILEASPAVPAGASR
jgi:GDP-L-fucose synthase